jgi:hypothetical protein
VDWPDGRITVLRPDGPYRAPTGQERADAVAGLVAVLDGRPAEKSGRFTVTRENGYTLLAESAHGWGSVVLGGGPLRQVVEVPHPVADRLTGRLGLELFLAMPGSALLVAGAHRSAGGGAADVAHRADSVFHAFACVLAARAGVEVQVHGFADERLPGADAVVSPGAGQAGERHLALRDALTGRGFTVGSGAELAGRTNVQGVAAAARGSAFLHLELSRTPRADPGRRAEVVAAVASTWAG